MINNFRIATLVGFGLVACSAGTSLENVAPQQEGHVTTTSGLDVSATIAAVTLGDECGNVAGGTTATGDSSTCTAPPPASDAVAAAGGSQRVGSGTGCGGSRFGGCQPSNVQLSFSASTGTKSAKVEIVTVTLLDGSSGAELDTLSASTPESWDGSGYRAWDQSVSPSAALKTSYTLSSPAWSRIGNPYSRSFKVRVTLHVDGATLVVQSAILNREPAVST